MNQYQVILRATNDDQEQFDLELTNSPQFFLCAMIFAPSI